jgi:hypothetical protein
MEEMGHRSQGAKGLIAPCDVSWPCWLTALLASIVKDGGSGLAVKTSRRVAGRCSHGFGLLARFAGPLAIVLSADRSRSKARIL